MRTLGPLYEILALGEARFRSKLISVSRMTVTSKVLSPVMYHLPDMVLEFVVYLLLDPQPGKVSIIELALVNITEWGHLV